MLSFKNFLIENKMLERHYKFSPEESETIENYTATGFKPLALNEISKKHKSPINLTLHAGLSDEKAKELGLHKPVSSPKTISFPQVQATSLDKKVAREFGRHRIVIDHPKGSYGAYIDHHSDRIVPEKEFILPEGHRVTVTHSEVDKNGNITHYAKTEKMKKTK